MGSARSRAFSLPLGRQWGQSGATETGCASSPLQFVSGFTYQKSCQRHDMGEYFK